MKTNRFIFAIATLVAISLIFVSCSKDDDNDNGGGGEKSHSLIGGWMDDDSDNNAQFCYIFEEDGTALSVEIQNPEDADPDVDVMLIDWSESKGRITFTRGVCKESVDFFFSSDGKRINITDEDGDSQTLTRLTESELQTVRAKLNLDPDLVGFWKNEAGTGFVELDPDGHGTQLIFSGLDYFTSLKWETKDGVVSFKTFKNATAKRGYTVADDKSYFMFGTLKYERITEQEYKKQFNAFNKTVSIVKAWELQTPWTSDFASSIMNPVYRNCYVVFNADGTFFIVALKAKDSKGANITEVKKYEGKWQFDRSLFTYTINKNDQYGAVPWRLQQGFLMCGLPFYASMIAYDKYWGNGDFAETDIDKVQQYIEGY